MRGVRGFPPASQSANQPTHQLTPAGASDRRVKDISKYRHRSASDTRLRFSRLHAGNFEQTRAHSTWQPEPLEWHFISRGVFCCWALRVPLFFPLPFCSRAHTLRAPIYISHLYRCAAYKSARFRGGGGSGPVVASPRLRKPSNTSNLFARDIYMYIFISLTRGHAPRRGGTRWPADRRQTPRACLTCLPFIIINSGAKCLRFSCGAADGEYDGGVFFFFGERWFCIYIFSCLPAQKRGRLVCVCVRVFDRPPGRQATPAGRHYILIALG